MTSAGRKEGQIWKLLYLHQYFSYSVDQKLKISEILMAILLIYSTSGTPSGEKVCRDLKMATRFEIYETPFFLPHIWKGRPKLYKKRFFFIVMTSSVTSQGGLKFGPIYPCLGEACSGSNWQGQCLVNTCQCNGLSRSYMPKEDHDK